MKSNCTLSFLFMSREQHVSNKSASKANMRLQQLLVIQCIYNLLNVLTPMLKFSPLLTGQQAHTNT